MKEIIERCIENDTEAMSMLYEKYRTQVYRTSYLLTRNFSLADDITQESFIRIFSKLSLYKTECSFESWMYKLVLNVARNMLRKQKIMSTFHLLKEDEIVEYDNTPAKCLEKSEQKDILAEIIKSLPQKTREVIILKYFNLLSQEEIAEVLGIPLGTVKSRIHTGLEKIRIQIEANASLKEVLKGYEYE